MWIFPLVSRGVSSEGGSRLDGNSSVRDRQVHVLTDHFRRANEDDRRKRGRHKRRANSNSSSPNPSISCVNKHNEPSQDKKKTYRSQDVHHNGRPEHPALMVEASPNIDQILALTGMLSAALTSAATPPATCQYKVFVDAYPDPGCVVLNTGPANVQLFEGFFISPGECKSTSLPILSFRNAISDDSKAAKCTLVAYPNKGCTGKEFDQQPHKEAAENQCVDYTLSSLSLKANSFKLKCP
ncbi:MAG: hypothetical protein Q9168_004991 [Polycauliona sp. 1 TL-2023]